MQLTTGSHGVIMADAAGRITMLSDAARALLGLGFLSVNGRLVKEIIPDTRLTDVLLNDRESKEEKITANGKKLIISRTPVYENARMVGSIFIIQDTSELEKVKKQMQQLKEAKDELEAILDSSYDEISVVDAKGIIRKINKAGESFYGLESNELIGSNVYELEEQGYFSPSAARVALEKKEPVTVTQATRSGKELIVTGNPVFDEKGNVIRVVVNSRDVSELSSLRRMLKDTERLADNYRKQMLQLNTEQQAAQRDIIASSRQMVALLEMVDKVAAVDSTVLITGESGVGKGMVAQRIHKMSSRSAGPFITINCGAIPENLLESELFGYAPGAFTGARKGGKKGLIEMGSGGTVFLDEIGELPLNLQVKLLHVIQQKNVLPVGGTVSVDVDVRFVAATNRKLKNMVQEGSFREDLFYRLNVIPVEIPPLRERREDVDVLLNYYLDLFNKKYGMVKRFSKEVKEILDRYSWPGNVREVENIVERLAVTSDGAEIKPVHLPEYVLSKVSEKNNTIYIPDLCPLDDAVQEVERQLIERAFKTFGNTYRMAEALNINQSTVVRKMKKYLSAPKRKPGPKKENKKYI